jgi:oxygen-independent coproporphyrinogen-3 oxidase
MMKTKILNHSIYIHVPFCIYRCAYCDFNTYAKQEILLPAYIDALCREIYWLSERAPQRLPVHTIFFGGGTPSLLSTPQFDAILKAVKQNYDLLPQAEISLEANPGTVTLQSLRDLRSLGFNRISLGVQSSHPEELLQLERIHDYYDVINAVTWARLAGFDNLNLDLIFGLPEQSLRRWQETIQLILSLHPKHLSLYGLTLEHGTPFGRWAQRGLLPVPNPDAAADMYEWASEVLEMAGYQQYEISNWAKPGRECLHNLQTWRGKPYLGFGAGAHGCANGMRISNVLRIKTYIEHLQPDRLSEKKPFPLSPATSHQINLSVQDEMQETMLTGLRLTKEGVNAESFLDRFGVQMQDVFAGEIKELIELDLLEWASPILRLTKRGRLLGNRVFIRFV